MLSADQKFITAPKKYVKLYETMEIQIKYVWAYLYATMPYVYFMNIHLFIQYCRFHLICYTFFFSSFGWFSVRSVIFEWPCCACIHTHTLLIINGIAHSDEIIPASLFRPINIKFLYSRVHLSYIILCRLSFCCILFVSGRLFFTVCRLFQMDMSACCVYTFHNIVFHVRMNAFNNGFLLV